MLNEPWATAKGVPTYNNRTLFSKEAMIALVAHCFAFTGIDKAKDIASRIKKGV